MSTQNVTEMPFALEPDGIQCQIDLIKIASSASALEPDCIDVRRNEGKIHVRTTHWRQTACTLKALEPKTNDKHQIENEM